MNKKFWALTLTLIATVALSLATTGSSAPQGGGKVLVGDFPLMVITGDDIRNLPSGESRIVHQNEDGNTAYVGTPNGGVWKLTNGGGSVPLTKIGAGTLILPNTYQGLTQINSGVQSSTNNTGLTKVGPGTLQNAPAAAKGGITKYGSRRLMLDDDGTVVYEFRDLGPQDFEQVVVPTAHLPQEQISLPYVNIKTRVQQHRPASAMKGWPFKRLLIGSAKGIAQVEGWKPGKIANPTPVRKSVCSGGFCQCSGSADCLSLADSGWCSSDMNCDGSDGSTRCYCKAN
jgi:autotransporter-associated beta strand protein